MSPLKNAVPSLLTLSPFICYLKYLNFQALIGALVHFFSALSFLLLYFSSPFPNYSPAKLKSSSLTPLQLDFSFPLFPSLTTSYIFIFFFSRPTPSPSPIPFPLPFPPISKFGGVALRFMYKI